MPEALIHLLISTDVADAPAKRAPANAKPAQAGRPSGSKMTVEAAWAAWQADGAALASSEFLRGVSSWTEGTAAQLLRLRWPADMKRPTSAEVQDRLRHNLGLVARGPRSTSIEALAKARVGVIEEFRRAQHPAAVHVRRRPERGPTMKVVPARP